MGGGFMVDYKVLYPVHWAAFSVVISEVDRAPALDGLAIFGIIEENGESYVEVKALFIELMF